MFFYQKEAIGYSWELLTEVYKLPKDRLYVTFFEGDPKIGLGPDEEARQIWLDAGVADDHILPGNTKDNFWGMRCLSCAHTTPDLRRTQKWAQLDHVGLAGELHSRCIISSYLHCLGQ